MTARGALHGRCILEIADESGAYCGKLLADLGADVIKIEPPARAGVPPSPAAAYLDTNKRSLVLDLDAAVDREQLRALARGADALVETTPVGALERCGLGWERLASENPRLVLTSITGFGRSGPRAAWASCDLVTAALSGAMHVTGEAEDPPVVLAGRQASMTASVTAAAATLIAIRHASVSGEGQRVDVSALEASVAASHICGIGKWRDDGIVPRRNGASLFASVPSGTYRCRDGLVYLMINRPKHWQALARWIAEVTGVESVLDPLFEGPSSRRIPYRDLVDAYVADLTGRFTVDEVYHEGQRRHLAFTPVQTIAAMADDAHLAARGFFVEVAGRDGRRFRMPGAPYRLAATPWTIHRPAPVAGEHQTEVLAEIAAAAAVGAGATPRATTADGARGRGALAGIRVLELTAAMAGPWIGRFMAACGAEVIRVESRAYPDVVRLYVPPRDPAAGVQPQRSPWFTDWNAGKRFVALDLTNPGAVALARRLAAASDVVIENASAGVMAKLGLGWEALHAVQPALVMLSTSGYGAVGPQRGYVTWGPNIEALSGLATLSGFPHRDCTITQYAYPDALGALHGLVAVLAALEHRRRTGEGQWIDLAQLETTIAALGDVLVETLNGLGSAERLGNGSRTMAPHGCYPCRGDDRWCAIAVRSEDEWRRFCAILDTDWTDDARFATVDARLANAGALDAAIAGWTATRDAADVMTRLQDAGISAGVVQDVAALARDPQLLARGFFEEIPHVEKGTVVATGIPLGLTATPLRSGLAGQAIGQDHGYVFGEVLGMSAAEIAAAVASGAIEDADA